MAGSVALRLIKCIVILFGCGQVHGELSKPVNAGKLTLAFIDMGILTNYPIYCQCLNIKDILLTYYAEFDTIWLVHVESTNTKINFWGMSK